MNQNQEIAVLFCANRSYCEPMATAIASLLANNRSHSFRIFVALSDDGGEGRARIAATVQQFPNAELTFRKYDCAALQGFPAHQRITVEAYIRLFLADILDPDIDRVLYFDCDLIVCGDIGELWHTHLGDYALGAVQDQFCDSLSALGFAEDDPYYNSGVLVIDVAAWKAARLTESIVRYILEHPSTLRYCDQDAINAVLRGRICPLHPRWNFSPRHADAGPELCGLSKSEFRAVRSRPSVVHFIGIKPWQGDTHYRNLYLRYHAMTPWHTDPANVPARNLRTIAADLLAGSKAWVKWHLPSLSRGLRNWTGAGDPTLQIRGKLRDRTAQSATLARQR